MFLRILISKYCLTTQPYLSMIYCCFRQHVCLSVITKKCKNIIQYDTVTRYNYIVQYMTILILWSDDHNLFYNNVQLIAFWNVTDEICNDWCLRQNTRSRLNCLMCRSHVWCQIVCIHHTGYTYHTECLYNTYLQLLQQHQRSTLVTNNESSNIQDSSYRSLL